MHYLVLLASRNKNPLSQTQTQSTTLSQTNSNQQPEDSIPDISSLDDLTPLSEPEATFLHSHQTLLAGHYAGSFMGAFPKQLRRLDDNAGGTSMIQGPEVREVVFVRCLGAEVPVVVGGEEDGGDYGVTMRMGDVWVVRWEGVKGAWGRGEVELL
jgi:GINS complex subunit 4